MKHNTMNKGVTLAALGLLIGSSQEVSALSTSHRLNSLESLDQITIQDKKHHHKHKSRRRPFKGSELG